MDKPSQSETLLRAAKELPASFTPEALLIAAWHEDNDAFDLRHFNHRHPDARKVQNLLYGARGLIKRGYLMWVGESLQLTSLGRERLKALEASEAQRNGATSEPAPAAASAEELPELLVAAKRSVAFAAFLRGKKTTITRGQAIDFWSSDSREQVEQAFIPLLADRDSLALRQLRACHDWLWERYKELLD